MSANNGRRGLNVTTYLQNLNMPPQEDVIEYNPADDLSLWTDTTFFDFDLGTHVERTTPEEEERKPTHDLKSSAGDFDFLNGSFVSMSYIRGVLTLMILDLHAFDPAPFDYNPEFTGFGEPQLHPAPPPSIPVQHVPAIPLATHSHTLPKVAPIAAAPISAPNPAPHTPVPVRSVKRKASAISTPSTPAASPEDGGLEEQSRLAAEEDKRRRNTAASARFRIKKKQKEQQLEKTAREMTDRVTVLEQRIQTLEMENKWLKNLIVEKNGGKSGEEVMPTTIDPETKDGVGTF